MSASKNQLPGLSINGTLVENGLFLNRFLLLQGNVTFSFPEIKETLCEEWHV